MVDHHWVATQFPKSQISKPEMADENDEKPEMADESMADQAEARDGRLDLQCLPERGSSLNAIDPPNVIPAFGAKDKGKQALAKG